MPNLLQNECHAYIAKSLLVDHTIMVQVIILDFA